MTTAVLMPLTKLRPEQFLTDSSAVEAASSDLQEAAAKMQEQAAAESICNALNRALTEKQIRCRVLNVSLHIQPDGSISISEVSAEGNLLTGTVILREWLGDDIRITEGGAPLVSD